MPKANVPEKRASSNRNKNKGTAAAAAPVHKVEWAKNPDWTWSLIAYLTDHPTFKTKLFSDSTADASKEGRNKAVAKDGRPQQYAVLAKHIFENDTKESSFFKKTPGKYTSSVETRLRRSILSPLLLYTS